MKLVYARRAVRRLTEIADYVRERNPGAADKVEGSIRETTELLRRHPYVGRRARPWVRVFAVPRLPYLIYYQVDERREIVTIITLRHAAQDRLA
ncbi:type II toxin-antitoxin system RelE/ParE family toxin [Methylobacterium sp. J-077]|uniref:type II toxin-antitoxin system RelE/ParE family toxin n=1 Tax=Methylobacterium sp. J-077 TaxID=2836656 RepID=UPI001FB8A246|nr:type II toxin-antitoxin system RelE/ParE family toxin [Methylobacterium sp. J-077]MCJ2126884.1 type II toxin-antitoxin system RelE/ParE family toxin [Methylobacterium sp. J-077]